MKINEIFQIKKLEKKYLRYAFFIITCDLGGMEKDWMRVHQITGISMHDKYFIHQINTSTDIFNNTIVE